MPLPEEQALAQPVCGAAYLQSSTAAGKAANFGCRLSGASNAEEQARFEAEAGNADKAAHLLAKGTECGAEPAEELAAAVAELGTGSSATTPSGSR